MAKRHRRRYRGLGAFSLGSLKSTNANAVDVLMGAAAGIAGVYAVKFVVNKLGDKVPEIVKTISPVLGGALAAGLLFALQKKNRSRAMGTAIGAGIIGLAIQAKSLVDNTGFAQQHGLADYGVVLDEGGMLNAYVDDQPSLSDLSAHNLAMLSAMNESDYDEDDFADADELEELLDA